MMKNGRGNPAALYVKQHNCSFADAARVFEVNPNTVLKQFRRMFPGERGPAILKRNTMKDRIEELWEDGYSVREICIRLHINKRVVWDYASQKGLAFKEYVKTNEIYVTPANDVRNGKSINQAAKDHGVNRASLNRYCQMHGIKSQSKYNRMKNVELNAGIAQR